jgi:hypothetical protein
MTPQTEVRVAIIAGVVQVLVGFIALFGTLATSSDPSSTPAAGPSPTVTTTLSAGASTAMTSPTAGGSTAMTSPTAGGSCASLIREYRELIRLDPALARSLTEAGADGVAPIDVDPDARRCGIDATLLTTR